VPKALREAHERTGLVEQQAQVMRHAADDSAHSSDQKRISVVASPATDTLTSQARGLTARTFHTWLKKQSHNMTGRTTT
jgi:hypothetical protein